MNMRLVMVAGLVALGTSLLILAVSANTRLLGDQSGYKPVQPIAYSHALHAGDNKLDCQFCHSGAEKGPHAGIPPLSTCMKCHEAIQNKPGTRLGTHDPSPEILKLTQAWKEGRPVEWVRIHRLPAHVQFQHSRHVNAGVACQTCHGEVQGMERAEQARSLTMGECLACHRDENRKSMLNGKIASAPTDCSACHH